MYDQAIDFVKNAKKIMIIQAENPDGDSLGSALAMDEILADQGKETILYCPVDIPKYLRYVNGWDRIEDDFDMSCDCAIIVDTAAEVLISKVLDIPGSRHFFETHPVLVIDHHISDSNLSFEHTLISDDVVATAEIIYDISTKAEWKINAQAAENMMIAIMSDSLGLTIESVTPKTYYTVGKLTELGAKNSDIEKRRREFMKKPAEILTYKAKLIERIEYYLNGQMAFVHIPWEEIQEYSDQYNPSMLVLDEMRLVNDVQVAIAIKTYPDGKLTGKIRSNTPIAQSIAGYFGGGGHEYAAGFRIYEAIDAAMPELIDAVSKAIKDNKNDI